jgi:uncharacterized protein (DUF1015 family)
LPALYPFRALRPTPSEAARVAAVPYDVVSTDEARALARGNPLSFLHVSRAEIDLPAGQDPYGDEVYRRAAGNFDALKRAALVVEDEPSLYFYRLSTGAHEQTGLAACFSIDDYDRDVIRKHERTRRDKEDDRTRHMLALRAQTGPVFLIYPAAAEVNGVAAHAAAAPPLFDFQAEDGVRHTIWRTEARDRDALVAAFRDVPALYIADGHHRAASAARARTELEAHGMGPGARDAEYRRMLAVAFPHDQVRILPYNRVVKDLAGLTPASFLEAVARAFDVGPGSSTPARAGEIAMYLDGTWRTLRAKAAPSGDDVIARLDVTILQERLLEPILRIADVRTDKRIDFVGGARGTAELERLVGSGQAAVAFSLFPVQVSDLMTVSDRGGIMPPKSTWFEPKLRDGLLSHMI